MILSLHLSPCFVLKLYTFHILTLNSCLPFPQVDVSSSGAHRVAFNPDCRQFATSVNLLSEPVHRLQLNKLLPAVQPSSLCVAHLRPSHLPGLYHHGHRVHLLGLFLLLWTLSGIPQAWVRLHPAFSIVLPSSVSAF